MGQRECGACGMVARAGSVCEKMTPRERASMSGRSRRITLRKGDAIADPGSSGTLILLVFEGVVGIEHYLRDGRRALSELCFAGDIIDSLPGSRRLQGAVVGLTDASLCAFDGTTFEAIRQANEAVDQAFTVQLREQARMLRDHCVDIGRKTPGERVASFLFEQMRRLPESRQKPGVIRVPLTLSEIGDYLALQPETVSRSISRLAADGLIALVHPGVFRLVDEAGLRRVANGGSPRRRKTSNPAPIPEDADTRPPWRGLGR